VLAYSNNYTLKSLCYIALKLIFFKNFHAGMTQLLIVKGISRTLEKSLLPKSCTYWFLQNSNYPKMWVSNKKIISQ